MNINFSSAQALAEQAAREELFWVNDSSSFLSTYVAEGEACWIFFRKEAISVPPEYSLKDGAYAVSRKGNVRLIAAFEKDSKELEDYLNKISDYFLRNDE